MALRPDGRRIASGSGDRTVKVGDVRGPEAPTSDRIDGILDRREHPMSHADNPYDRPLVRWAMLVTMAFAIVILPFLEFNQIKELIYAINTSGWPHAEAVVTKSKLNSFISGTHVSYEPNIEYEYWVAGKTYRGTGTRVGGATSQHEFDAQWIVDRFPLGTRTPVSYNPTVPSESLLLPGAQWVHYVCVVTPPFFFVAFVALFIHLCRDYKAQAKPEVR